MAPVHVGPHRPSGTGKGSLLRFALMARYCTVGKGSACSAASTTQSSYVTHTCWAGGVPAIVPRLNCAPRRPTASSTALSRKLTCRHTPCLAAMYLPSGTTTAVVPTGASGCFVSSSGPVPFVPIAPRAMVMQANRRRLTALAGFPATAWFCAWSRTFLNSSSFSGSKISGSRADQREVLAYTVRTARSDRVPLRSH